VQQELTLISAEIRCLEPYAAGDTSDGRSREQITAALRDEYGFAPEELVEWYFWLENELSGIHEMPSVWSPFHA